MTTQTRNCRHGSVSSYFSGNKISLIAVAIITLIAIGVPSLRSAVKPKKDITPQQIVQPLQQDTVLQESVTADIERTFAPSADLIINSLKQCSLWELDLQDDVPPVLFDRYPANLYEIDDISVKKRIFLHTLLPIVLTALREIDAERKIVQAITKKMDQGLTLSGDEQKILFKKIRKYRAGDNEDLLAKLNRIPTSLILAQAAVESSWGSSRFTRDANNLFGMWTWGKRGIIPERRDEDQTHKIRIYDSILDSVRSYILNLNRHVAYEPFRNLRQETTDSLSLIKGLMAYSARGEDYIEELSRIITFNDLQKYDRCQLAADKIIKVSNSTSLITTIQ